MLEHAGTALGCAVGATSDDGLFTLEEAECLADCGIAPCVQVNHRYVHATTPTDFDHLVEQLRRGALDHDVPAHGSLVRVRRSVGLRAARSEVVQQRASAREARAAREAGKES
jgi:hypothetical protein